MYAPYFTAAGLVCRGIRLVGCILRRIPAQPNRKALLQQDGFASAVDPAECAKLKTSY